MSNVLVFLGLSLVPSTVWGLWWQKRGGPWTPRVNPWTLMIAGAGAAAISPDLGALISTDPFEGVLLRSFHLAFVGIALPEEALKLVALLVLGYLKNGFSTTRQAMVAGACVALGFHTTEVVTKALLQPSLVALLVHLTTATLLGVACGSLVGFFAGHATKAWVGGLVGVFFHGSYDWPLSFRDAHYVQYAFNVRYAVNRAASPEGIGLVCHLVAAFVLLGGISSTVALWRRCASTGGQPIVMEDQRGRARVARITFWLLGIAALVVGWYRTSNSYVHVRFGLDPDRLVFGGLVAGCSLLLVGILMIYLAFRSGNISKSPRLSAAEDGEEA